MTKKQQALVYVSEIESKIKQHEEHRQDLLRRGDLNGAVSVLSLIRALQDKAFRIKAEAENLED